MAEAQKLKLIDGWEVVIGIEIHTQLATKSKIFSGSSTEFGQDPNTQASLVDLAMPGVLPVLNKQVVDLAIRFGLVLVTALFNLHLVFLLLLIVYNEN